MTDTNHKGSNDMDKQTVIAEAATTGGYAIGIIRYIGYQSRKPVFEVVRMDSRHYVTLTRHNDEAAARTSANTEWKADMAAMRKKAVA